MRRLLFLLVVLAIAACSQRVTPEDEYSEESRERTLLPVARTPDLLAGGAGRAAMTRTIPEEASAQAIRGTIEGPAAPDAPVSSTAALYVFVRPAEGGGGPPLAVQRHSPDALPLEFAIGPEHAMLEGTTFPERVVVEARLDQDGNAMSTGEDDWTARSEPVAPGAEGVVLELAP